jgi:hypothetical protein
MTPANVDVLIEKLVQAAVEYENNCDRLVAKPMRIELEKAKQAIRETLIPDVAQTEKVRLATIEECARIADSQAQEFLSPEYAANQPFGSFCERFACDEVAKTIRALADPPVVPPEVLERRRKGLPDYERPPLGQPPSWLQEQEKIERHNGSSAVSGEVPSLARAAEEASPVSRPHGGGA